MPTTHDSAMESLTPLIAQGTRALGASYLAIFIGLLSVVPNAKGTDAILTFLQNTAWPFLLGALFTLFGYAGSWTYEAERAEAVQRGQGIPPLNPPRRRLIASSLIFGCLGLAGLMFIFIAFAIMVESLKA